jgi:hypothetical protein
MIRTKLFGFCLLLATSAPSLAGAQPAPQTARQALIEMFFSKTPGTLDKHLPEAMREVLKKANAGPEISLPGKLGLILKGGQGLQTYEAGPILLSLENAHDNSKFEVVVESDDLQADEDEIEVSFRSYKDGQAQLSGQSPRVTFGMKQESGVWRLNEMTFTFKISLSDPEFLKALSSWKSVGNSSQYPMTSSSVATPSSETSVVSAMRTIMAAEATYAGMYGHGYTCSLSDLGGMGGSERDDHQAMLIEPRLANGKKNGYVFALAGCAGSSVSKFTLTAVPAEGAMGLNAFCSDESGVIRVSSDGNGASCLSSGRPLP